MEVDSVEYEVKIETEDEPSVKIEETTSEGFINNNHCPEKYHEIYKCYKDKDYENCLLYMSEVTEELVEYQILKSACLIHLGNLSEAHEILDEILEKDQDNAYTIYAKGLAYYHEENYKESVGYFERARSLDPSKDMERAELMIDRAEEKLSEQKQSMKPAPARNQTSTFHFKRSPISSHIVRRFGCEICDHFFGKKFNLDRHNKSLHRRSTPLDFPTRPTQSAQSSSSNSPKTSQKTSLAKTKPTPLKLFPVKQRVQQAAVLLSKAKKGKVKCPTCNRTFRKSSIARHMIIHSGHKPHKCSECSMAFFQKSDLFRHMVS